MKKTSIQRKASVGRSRPSAVAAVAHENSGKFNGKKDVWGGKVSKESARVIQAVCVKYSKALNNLAKR